jgi:hypothetical protein
MLLFKPETVLKWHRELVKRKWTFQQTKRHGGHPALDAELEALIVQLARDNQRLGYKKLVGELRKLGYRVGRSTVRAVLKHHHIRPAPERGRTSSSWPTFLNSHKAQLLANRSLWDENERDRMSETRAGRGEKENQHDATSRSHWSHTG